VEIIRRALSEGRNRLSEYESKQVLKAYGIPVTREIEVSGHQALSEAYQAIGFPLVLKGCGSRFSHKTERNLVRVDIRSPEEAVTAFDQLMREVEKESGKVLVQEMVKGRRELVAGLTRDPQFGPCVMFGLGGIFTEILMDISFRPAPLTQGDAVQMIKEIKGVKILGEVRGSPPADLDQLTKLLVHLGTIGIEEEYIQEIDVNPVILDGARPVAVDALVVLRQEFQVTE